MHWGAYENIRLPSYPGLLTMGFFSKCRNRTSAELPIKHKFAIKGIGENESTAPNGNGDGWSATVFASSCLLNQQ